VEIPTPQAKIPSVATSAAPTPDTSTSVVQDDSGQRPSVTTLGTFIGVVIGGINHGIFGAMVGAPLAMVVVVPVLDGILRDTWSKGRRRLFEITMPAAFVTSGASAWFLSRIAPGLESLFGGETSGRDNVAFVVAHYALPGLAALLAAVATIRLGSSRNYNDSMNSDPQTLSDGEIVTAQYVCASCGKAILFRNSTCSHCGKKNQ
jgi:hypothetical protein